MSAEIASMEIIMIDTPRAYPPRVTAFTRPFWEGLSDGVFRTTRCQSCARLTFPPKPICPHCWTDGIDWEAIPPSGVLYSWTRIHAGPAVFAAQLPYAVGVVDLDVGLRIACRLWDSGASEWACGVPVQMVTLMAPDGGMFAAKAGSSCESAYLVYRKGVIRR
jgi:uncharacterized protein